MKDGKVFKYLLYALGEIALVVIGILIALSLNNGNDLKKKVQREKILLKELVANLETNIKNLQKDVDTQTISYGSILYVIDHMEQKRGFFDSLPKVLQNANFAPDVILASSSYETLKSSGLELIKKDTVRRTIFNLFEVVYPNLMQETKRLEDQLWPSLVMPLYQKHMRNVNDTWVPVDYEAWINDEEFINMLSFRGSLRKNSTKLKREAAISTQAVIDLINQELKQDFR